ncbi:hypothetical protein [Nocardioides sp.]|uniref:hypothetical protein n=1 Tax=Nocardioides sp. TaxID=35761 RepID=UPI0035626A56
MRFTEHEMTVALAGCAKAMLATQRKDIRKGQVDVDEAWEQLGGYQRFTMLDALGGQVLPVLHALPDVEVPDGTRPTFTDQQIRATVEETLGEAEGGRLRRKATLAARVALVKIALNAVPPRRAPDVDPLDD